MFGCFTRNTYVSKICSHFVCAFELSHDSLEKGKDQERASLCWGGECLLFREDKLPHNVILCSPNSCEVWAPAVLMSLWKLCLGIGGRGLCRLRTRSPAYTMLFFQSANLYMYIQAMFTEKYLHRCRQTCSQLSLLGKAWQIEWGISYRSCFQSFTPYESGYDQSMLNDVIMLCLG